MEIPNTNDCPIYDKYRWIVFIHEQTQIPVEDSLTRLLTPENFIDMR